MTAPLRAVQEWFQIATTHPGTIEVSVEAAARAAGFGRLEELDAVVTRGPRLSARERLGIYHEGYRARLVECLADDFPALRHALGEDAFEALAVNYIADHPSESPTLNGYGQYMAAFCRCTGLSNASFLAELAALEWALVLAVHAPAGAPLTLDALAALSPASWARARFVPAPSLQVLHFDYPVGEYYRALLEECAPGSPGVGPCTLLPANARERRASSLAVLRQGLTLWRHDLARPAGMLLEELATGRTLELALTQLESAEIAEGDVTRWFRRWIQDGFFTALEVQPD